MVQNEQPRNGHPYPGMEENDDYYGDEDIEMTDALDHEILMHRDAHFGGSFDVMLEYYQEDHVGVNPDFDIERISYLAQVQNELGKNLAALLLTASEAERVAKCRLAYQKFKEIYSLTNANPKIKLIADLILTEEEEPEELIENVAAYGKSIVPDLVRIIESDETFDPLFPGYGYAPYLAALCLGKIADPSAIIPLFEMLGKERVFDEEVIIAALGQIGQPAKDFLLKTLKSRPLTNDNIHAAISLVVFADDEDVAIAAFQQLSDSQVKSHQILPLYLLALCDQLRSSAQREAFVAMAKDTSFSPEFRRELEQMIRDWQH